MGEETWRNGTLSANSSKHDSKPLQSFIVRFQIISFVTTLQVTMQMRSEILGTAVITSIATFLHDLISATDFSSGVITIASATPHEHVVPLVERRVATHLQIQLKDLVGATRTPETPFLLDISFAADLFG